MVYINGILANQEDIELLKKRVFDENALFDSIVEDEFGNQYIEID